MRSPPSSPLDGCSSEPGVPRRRSPTSRTCPDRRSENGATGQDDGRTLLDSMIWEGDLLDRTERREESRTVLEAAVALSAELLGPLDDRTTIAEHWLAMTLAHQGEYDAAITRLRHVFEVEMQTQGAASPRSLSALGYLATWLVRTGQQSEARMLATDLLEARRRTLGHDHPDIEAAAILMRSIDDGPEGPGPCPG